LHTFSFSALRENKKLRRKTHPAIIVVMLAPIITKDMKLFPTRTTQLPPSAKTHHLKNVRSRAQSLNEIGSAHQQAHRSRVISARQRSSQSVGHLPTVLSRSPPKPSTLRGTKPGSTTLDAIVEGVELDQQHTSTPDLHLKSASTTTAPVDEATASAPSLDKHKQRNGLIKWLTGALKSSNRKDGTEQLIDDDAGANDLLLCKSNSALLVTTTISASPSPPPRKDSKSSTTASCT
jgi:hypothetical protein